MSMFVFDGGVIATQQQKIIDYIMIPISIILSIPLLIYLKKYIIITNKILLVVIVVISSINLAKAVMQTNKRIHITSNVIKQNTHRDALLDFSKDNKNIIVLILDRADGYTTHKIFKENKELKKHFSGFIDFTNAISSSAPTLPTLTSIVAGKYYTALEINKRHITNDLQTELSKGYADIFNAFEKEGYETSGIVTFPTDETHLYPLLINKSNIMFDTTQYRKMYINKYIYNFKENNIPFKQLISFGLFKLSTFKLRRDIYRSGAWLFSNVCGDWSLKPIAEIVSLAEDITNNATQPTFKFIHNAITHDLYGLNSHCEFSPNNISSRKDKEYALPDGHYNSEMCAFKLIAQMLDRLKELGAYDNTQIFITSDHGAQYEFLPIKANVHTPLFYKPFNAKGEMKIDSRLMANYDIASIFCDNLKYGCPNVFDNILKNFPLKRQIYVALGGGWDFSYHKKNYFIFTTYFEINSNDIYNKNNWIEVKEPQK